MLSSKVVQKALERDRLRSKTLRLTLKLECNSCDNDTDSDDDDNIWAPTARTRRRESLRDAGKKVIKSNAGNTHGVKARMVLDKEFRKLERERGTEHADFIAHVLGNTALMAKTTRALESVRDFLFSSEQTDKITLFNDVARVLHQLKVTVASTCWDDFVLPCKEELNERTLKHESIRRVLQESRETYLKEVAALRDQVRMRGDVDDELPSMDIVSYFDPEYVMLPGEQAFLLDAVKEKVKMMIERNPKVENCINFGQFDRLQNRVESNALQDTKKALKHALARLKEAEAVISKNAKLTSVPQSVEPTAANDDGKIVETLEAISEDLRGKLYSEQNELRAAKKTILRLEGERDDLSQTLRNVTTEQIMHKTELNRLQERLSHYESLTHATETEIAKLQDVLKIREDVIQTHKLQIEKLEKKLSRQTKQAQQTEELFVNESLPSLAEMADESLPSLAEMAAGTQHNAIKHNADSSHKADYAYNANVNFDYQTVSKELTSLRDDRDAALARCADLSAQFNEMRQMVRCQIERFIELKSENDVDFADSVMEQAELLGCVNMEGAAEGARICGCGNILVHDAIFCRKCGTKWQKAALIAKDVRASEDALVSLTLQLKATDQHLDAAMTELRDVLQSQGARQDGNLNDGVEFLEKLLEAQHEVDAYQSKKRRLEAMVLETRVRVAKRASLEMPVADNQCTCNCAAELRATRKLLDRIQNLCTESTASLQRFALENSVVNATLGQMRDTLGKAASTAQSVAADNPDLRFFLQTVNEARAQSVFHRLYCNTGADHRNERREARRSRLLQESFKHVYQMDASLPSNEGEMHTHAKTSKRPLLICTSLQNPSASVKLTCTAADPNIKESPVKLATGTCPHSAREKTAFISQRRLSESAVGHARIVQTSRVAAPDVSRQPLPPLKVQALSIDPTSVKQSRPRQSTLGPHSARRHSCG